MRFNRVSLATIRGTNGWAIVLAGLFFVGLIPFASDYILHFPDERHYTDAALNMLDTGDFLTPHTSSGEQRFHKPILAYWLVTASFWLFGISPLTARLPFLLAGAAIIVLTVRTAKLMYRDDRQSRFAGLILLCYPQLILAATRSIPDVLIALFLMLSASGFIGMIIREEPKNRDLYAANVGAGLAVLSKGLPAVVFVLFAWTFLLIQKRQVNPARHLWHWPSIFIGAAIALMWFAVVFTKHGIVAVNGFFGDQVTSRISHDFVQIPLQTGESFVALLYHFLPWSAGFIFVICQARSQPVEKSSRVRTARKFLLCWVGIVLLMMGSVNANSERYLLMASPMMAIWTAPIMLKGETIVAEAANRNFRRLLVLFGLAAGWFCFSVNKQLGHPEAAALILVLFLAYAVITAIAARRHSRWAPECSLAFGLFLLIPMLTLSLGHLVLPDQGAQISQYLHQQGYKKFRYVGKPAMPAKIRVKSGGAADLDWIDQNDTKRLSAGDLPLIVNSGLISLEQFADYELVPICHGLSDIHFEKLVLAISKQDLAGFLEKQREVHVIATPKAVKETRTAEREITATSDSSFR